MKKIIILSLCFMLSDFCAPAFAQETLSLQECREMALKYNKEMAASIKQTESTHYTAKSYKGNFFPNFTASGTGLYSNADGSYGIAGGCTIDLFLPSTSFEAAGFHFPKNIKTECPSQPIFIKSSCCLRSLSGYLGISSPF